MFLHTLYSDWFVLGSSSSLQTQEPVGGTTVSWISRSDFESILWLENLPVELMNNLKLLALGAVSILARAIC